MNLLIADTYEQMSQQAAADLIELTKTKEQPLLCVASGDSPAGLYQRLHSYRQNAKVDTSRWHFIELDEWMGMNDADEGSCGFYLNQQVFEPLGIEKARINVFDGKAEPQQECSRMDSFIQHHHGIDIAILGLGLNGHIGMNEPGTPATSRSHLSGIDPQTQQVGQKYFREPKEITHGLTLGIATIMEARNIILLVSGRRKAEIVQQVIEGEVSEQVPASLLRSHASFRVYLDREAAVFLKQ